MPIVITLPPELETLLRERAHQSGQAIESIASELLAKTLIADEQTHAATQAQELVAKLQQFEQQYHMDSRSFYEQFQAGKLGDSADFFEWNTYYEMLHGMPVTI